MNLSSQAIQILNNLRSNFSPPPDIDIDEWADTNRILSPKASSEPGLWRTSRTPYTREIMKELSPSSETKEICFMKGSQVAGTEILINTSLYFADCNPSPQLMIQPTLDVAKRYSRQRIGPSIEACVDLNKKINTVKTRDSSNTMLMKDYPGGVMILGGANSAASLRSMPIRFLGLDEIDAYPFDVEEEGSPVELAKRRITNFPRRKIFYNSTPGIQGFSNIESIFLSSDQRYYYVKCPFCGNMDIIKWENLKWIKRKPETVYLKCVKCSGQIKEHYKTQLLEGGKWIKHNAGSKIAGFHLSGLYSPLGWYSWEEAVDLHLRALTDVILRKVHTNTVLGETFNPAMVNIDPHYLMKRREDYGAELPITKKVLTLTAGVDVQDNRIEAYVYGWGRLEESWLIENVTFMGRPDQKSVWDQLDVFLLKNFYTGRGGYMNIACTCIDSGGHFTQETYKFCKPREYRRVFAIKGKGGLGVPLIGGISKNNRENCNLFMIGVDEGKEIIYGRLSLKEEGGGYIHFNKNTKEEVFNQITSEKKLKKTSSGRPILTWTLPPGKRNEALDCTVYALAALKILNPNLDFLLEQNKIFSIDYKKLNINTRKVRGRRVNSKGVRA